MTLRLAWRQALAWRMRRQLLEPIGDESVHAVVRQLCGVQSQVASSAELAVRVRRARSRSGEIARALSDGALIKTWAMRGALHLLTPEDGGAFLALIAAGRSWERPSWQRYFGMKLDDWRPFRDAVRDALDGRALTREELATAIVAKRRLAHLAKELRSGWGTLLKPLAWQGELCFGPMKDGRPTFMRPEDASARWAGLPELDEAAPAALVAYVGAYGPATVEAFGNWLSGGWFGKRQLRAWVTALGNRLVEVEVELQPALVLAEHVDELASTKPTRAVRLLPGFDQYVLGPGTGDGHVVPAARRRAVSKQSGWIAPIVVAGGVVGGTWARERDRIEIAWFAESGRPPRRLLIDEVARLSSIVGRVLEPRVKIV